MKRVLAILIMLCLFASGQAGTQFECWTASPATARGAQSAQRLHPAVVRVQACMGNGCSLGSGTFVGSNGKYGLVLTNAHVIRGARAITVHWPTGRSSRATVLRQDRIWDLAALRTTGFPAGLRPVKISERAPKVGEPVTCAGYGSGNYRAAVGSAVGYAAPAEQKGTLQFLVVSARIRQGDSGGPMLSRAGRLVGVLFGCNGRAYGAYCGRIRLFLRGLLNVAPPPSRPAAPPSTDNPPAPPPSTDNPPAAPPSADNPPAPPPSTDNPPVPQITPPPPGTEAWRDEVAKLEKQLTACAQRIELLSGQLSRVEARVNTPWYLHTINVKTGEKNTESIRLGEGVVFNLFPHSD